MEIKIGDVIKALIKYRGKKIGEVADQVGKTRTALSQICNNHYGPSDATMNKLAVILDIPKPVMWFLCIADSDVPPARMDLYKFMRPTLEKFLVDVFSISPELFTIIETQSNEKAGI